MPPPPMMPMTRYRPPRSCPTASTPGASAARQNGQKRAPTRTCRPQFGQAEVATVAPPAGALAAAALAAPVVPAPAVEPVVAEAAAAPVAVAPVAAVAATGCEAGAGSGASTAAPHST